MPGNTKADTIAKLSRVIETLQLVQKDMPLTAVNALLKIYLNEGTTQRGIEEALGTNSAAASRYVNFWASEFKPGVPGKDFIDQRINPEDRRYRVVSLKPQGRKFTEGLASILEG
jgi:DNA-binding MarR family transcriptional regulator